MKTCPACKGTICNICGGCINCGECGCRASERIRLMVRIKELEAALEKIAGGSPSDRGVYTKNAYSSFVSIARAALDQPPSGKGGEA